MSNFLSQPSNPRSPQNQHVSKNLIVNAGETAKSGFSVSFSNKAKNTPKGLHKIGVLTSLTKRKQALIKHCRNTARGTGFSRSERGTEDERVDKSRSPKVSKNAHLVFGTTQFVDSDTDRDTGVLAKSMEI